MILPVPAELISQMALDLKAHLARRNITEPRYIGIRTGGIWVAQALLCAMNSEAPLGTLDVSFYRDDFSKMACTRKCAPRSCRSRSKASTWC